MIKIKQIKNDFPVLKNNPKLIYLDSAATSLKPKEVVDKIIEYYHLYPANIFRGIYKISEKATKEYEETRRTVAKFINAKNPQEIIFTRSTTESLNLLTYSLGKNFIRPKDEILVSLMEHHSNFIPWQQLAKEKRVSFKVMPTTEKDDYLINPQKIGNQLTKKTKLVSFTFVSNVLGSVNPVKKIVKEIKNFNQNIFVVIDAAQAAPHLKIDVQSLGADFLAFSAHKMLGPTGVGILWGKKEILDQMKPFNYGGSMIKEVYFQKTIFQEIPYKFEAGTQNIADIIAFKEAIRYLEKINQNEIEKYIRGLTILAYQNLIKEFKKEIVILGPKNLKNRLGLIAFNLKNIHPHDLAQFLDKENICLRTGHHCCMPLHQSLNLEASCRISFYLYNTAEEIEKFIFSLKKIKRMLN